MTLRSRSCVIGRGVAMFSICSAMALASKIPTQIGRTFCPSLSRRITIGVFVTGSTIRPLMVISICIYLDPRRRGRLCQLPPHAVWSGALDAHGHGASDPVCRTRQVDDDVRARAPRELGVAPPACRVDEYRDRTA